MLRVLIFALLLLLSAFPAAAKEYNGSAWVDDACKYYNGAVWLDCTKKHYSGASWAEIEAGAPVGPVTISDDFSGTLANWTIETGSWNIASGELSNGSSNGVLSHNTDIKSINQYVLVKYVIRDYSGAYLRFDGNLSNYAYAVRGISSGAVEWRYCLGSSCTTIESTGVLDVGEGDYIGAFASGTGTNTTVDAWNFGNTPPANPDDPSTWGAPDFTFTADPANPADTGTYIGLYSGNAGLGIFDNFYGGSYTP